MDIFQLSQILNLSDIQMKLDLSFEISDILAEYDV